MINWAIAGLGIQGKKRQGILGKKVRATFDPYDTNADFSSTSQITNIDFEILAVCTPNLTKEAYLNWGIENRVSILVEKPLLFLQPERLMELSELAKKNKICIYTAYNHRFEPSIVQLQQKLEKKAIGTIYHVEINYENGTSRDIAASDWKDAPGNLITDLGSHVLDIFHFLFGYVPEDLKVYEQLAVETKFGDFCAFGNQFFSSTISYISWKSNFKIQVIGELGSFVVTGLQKWGGSNLIFHERIFPSGVPNSYGEDFVGSDKTWQLEHEFMEFNLERNSYGLISSDIQINRAIGSLIKQVLL